MRHTCDEPLFNSLMEEHHYLDYEQPVGEQLKYLVHRASAADCNPLYIRTVLTSYLLMTLRRITES